MREMRAAAAAVVVLALVSQGSEAAKTDRHRSTRRGLRNPPSVQGKVASGPNVLGTIQYDNDIPDHKDPSLGAMVGNRFAGLVDPHGLTMVTFRLAGAFGTIVTVSGYDPNTTAMTVMPLFPFFAVAGMMQSTAGTMLIQVNLPTPVAGHNGSFIAGVFNSSAYSTCATSQPPLGGSCDAVALTMGGTAVPGHAVRLQFPIAGTGVNIPNVNAIFRASGSNLPVELMEFSVK